MRVAVIGAGIIGVTTAYELSADGHRVTVFERRGSVAAESSFAHAGLLAAGCLGLWPTPALPGNIVRHLFGRHTPVCLRPTLNPATLAWAAKWWRASRARTYQASRLRMQRLAAFSLERLHTLTRDMKLGHEHAEGLLVLLRQPRDLAAIESGLASLAERNMRVETLDARQCRAVEPGLNPEATLHAGLYLPDDEVGNCRQFAHLLRYEAQKLGARFRFHTGVRGLNPGATPQLVHLYSPPEELPTLAPPKQPTGSGGAPTEPIPFEPITENFDAVVVCAALGAPALLRPHGVKLPLQAVHGYSLTAPLRQIESHPDIGPRAAIIDARSQIAISRLGARVRVAGMAELGGTLDHQSAAAFESLYKVLHDWFPGAARLSHAQRWKGARPMLPDGPPVLGASGVANVWLNLGHGDCGWVMACGSARLLADAVSGRAPGIDIDGLGVDRFAA